MTKGPSSQCNVKKNIPSISANVEGISLPWMPKKG